MRSEFLHVLGSMVLYHVTQKLHQNVQRHQQQHLGIDSIFELLS